MLKFDTHRSIQGLAKNLKYKIGGWFGEHTCFSQHIEVYGQVLHFRHELL